jgi:predicted deacylase
MSDVLALCPRRAASCKACSALLSHACTADMVLDLHCDAEAALHMYALPQHWPQWRSLSAHLNVKVGLLAEDSGGSSFDEACSLPWLRLSRAFPEAQIPLVPGDHPGTGRSGRHRPR